MTELTRRITELSPQKRALLLQRLHGRGTPAPSGIRPRDLEQSELPLSFAQQRLWFLDQLEPGSPLYNIPVATRFEGRLDVEALRRAIEEIVRRHEALRTALRVEAGRPLQVVAPAVRLELPVTDLLALPDAERDAHALRLAAEEARKPFDLSQPPLLRAALLRLREQDHVLLLTLHHVVSDGWSMGILVREVARLYEAFSKGQPSPLSELQIQYADFALWQREQLSGSELEAHLDYWRERLAGALQELPWATDRPRPARPSYRGAQHTFRLSPELSKAAAEFSQREGASLFMTLLAAFNALLHRYTRQEDLSVGSGIANRTRAEIEGLIGFFVNTLVLRTDLSGNPGFRQLVARVRETALDAFAHQDLPFEKLVEELRPERNLSHSPFFQTTFVLQNASRGALFELPGLKLSSLPLDSGTAKFDLTLSMEETPDGLVGIFEYSTDLFDAATIEGLGCHFERLLEGALAQPELAVAALPLSSDEDLACLVGWNATAQPSLDPRPVHLRVAAHAAERPQAPAIEDQHGALDYAELERLSNRVAHALLARGVGRDVPVAVFLERSTWSAVAPLAVLKAGGAFVPLDPDSPQPRLQHMLLDCDSHVLLTESALVRRLPEGTAEVLCLDDESNWRGQSEELPKVDVCPDDLAYVIYTSGSTGRPKGVMVPHRGLSNLVDWHLRQYGVGPDDKASLLAGPAFDAAVWELWPYLAAGASLSVPGEEQRLSPRALVEWLAGNEISLTFLPTPLCEAALRETWPSGLRLRALLTGGDRLRQRPPASLPFAVVNHYGPTEGSVVATAGEVAPSGTRLPSIGTPIDNVRAYVLDAGLRPVPAGVPGELCIAGPGLARGYWGRPELTAQRFVTAPDGERLYRTGDLARFTADGCLEFLGRLDQQVKLRGYRIELGELEAVLREHPSVQDAVAVAREDASGAVRLLAYVVQAESGSDGLGAQQVAEWRELFEETYAGSQAGDAAFDIVGWDSSYSGAPLPAEEMREWVDGTVERIQALEPRRVLEIGCGTGLLLFRLAPHCEAYVATDFSGVTVRRLEAEARRRGLLQVTLLERTAEDFAALQPGYFDAVVINSVVQYFPDVDYLVRVLQGAVQAVRPGGTVFVGDVRSFALLQAFHTAVALHQTPDSAPLLQLRARLHRGLESEGELAVDPALFRALASQLPGVGAVELQLRAGSHRNELTQFRYDALLRVGPAPVRLEALRLRFCEGQDVLAAAAEALSSGADAIVLEDLPNARVATELRALELLQADEPPATVGELRRAAAAAPGLEPEDFRELARLSDYDVRIEWSPSGREGRFDVILTLRGLPGVPDSPAVAAPPVWSRYANTPLREKLSQRLVPQLRAWMAERLPDYMLPSALVVLEALPLTPNGKLDRRALPDPDPTPQSQAAAFDAPRTPVEEVLAGIWSEVLARPRVGRDDDFFALGGHSLLATQVTSRVREAFKVELPLRTLFEAPTLVALAERIERRLREDQGPPVPAIVPVGRERALPLSFAQQRLWFLGQLDPGTSTYNAPMALRLRGSLDAPALERALAEILRRHEALRTAFASGPDGPVQVIRAAEPLTLPIDDLEALPEAERELQAQELAAAEAQRSFDLAAGPFLRARLLRLAAREHVLVLTLHHIASDGWSMGVLIRELGVLYGAFREGRASPLPELPVQYGDYAVWQREWLQGEALEAQLGYWRRQLGGELPVLELPGDRPRPPVQTFAGKSEPLMLPAGLLAELRALSAAEGVTLFMTLLAGFKALLARHAGLDDVPVGTPIAGRGRGETEALIGFFVNTLVLRTDLSGDPSFRELLQRVREVSLGAYSHQDVPFEKLVEELRPRRDLAHTPLFQVMFVLQNNAQAAFELPGLKAAPFESEAGAAAKFDLTLSMAETPRGLAGTLEYNVDLFDAATAQALLARLKRLLECAAAHPDTRLSELPLLAPEEQLAERCARKAPAAGAPVTLHGLFEAQAECRPSAPALRFAGSEVSYGELERRANRVARLLRLKGVGPEAIVALAAEPGSERLVALLGILKAGGAYLPLDPAHPQERLAYMLSDSRAALLVADTAALSRFEGLAIDALPLAELESAAAGEPDARLADASDPERLAYVIYTSGSTGRPKGVAVPHRGTVPLGLEQAPLFAAGPDSRLLQFASLSFDASVAELAVAWAVGACLVLARREDMLPGPALLGLLRREAVSVVTLPPAVLALLPEAELPALRTLVVAGEACSAELAARWMKGRLFLNAYGPTETTVCATVGQHLDETRRPAIGRALGHVCLHVLDVHGRPVPPGVPGELCVGGLGVARGYIGQPELTAERFVRDPFSTDAGARLYRTGDRVRRRADGELEFLGRLDGQIKLRGVRIEPGEVEAALRAQPGVREAAAVVREDQPGDRRLVAYVAGAGLAGAALREALKARLPESMLPSAIVALESLPLTPHGKLDRRALPAPAEAQGRAPGAPPASDLERRIAALWKDVLRVPEVGRDDNFFDLGGHSLLLAQVHARLKDDLGLDVPVVDLFRHPTVAALAQSLGTSPVTRELVPDRRRKQTDEPIAIVGLAGRFPGARDVESFWSNLRAGVESIRELSDEELQAAGVPPELYRDPRYVRRAAVVEDIDQFDAGFFGYSPREAESIDPQQRLFLECAHEALERASCDPERYSGRIGVYAGVRLSSYLMSLHANPQVAQSLGGFQLAMGGDKDFLPTRVSYKLDLKGPSLNVQTACSTSLVAVHVACQALRSGETDVALAGGSALNVPQASGYLFQEGGILSPDGHCRAFDAQAQGCVSGNGVGVVVLKRLSEALADGDHIHAVVRGSAINNDGALKVGYTAPSVAGQARVIQDALAAAGLEASSIGYVEAHGTGTALGDPIEIAALKQAFDGAERGACVVGALKTNVGHLDSAAGVAGLIKATLALEHEEIPPSLHFSVPNPALGLEDSPFVMNAELRPWTANGVPRRAGVSSFGIGGTNAHVVLEEAPAREAAEPGRPWQLLLLSARSTSALERAASDLRAHLETHPEQELADVAFTTQAGRRGFERRRALVCRDRAHALEQLARSSGAGIVSAERPAEATQMAWLFSGQGSQHVGMAQGLYRAEPLFKRELDHCAERLRSSLGFDLRDALFPAQPSAEAAERLKQTAVAQPALFAVEWSLARLWSSWGLEPHGLLGHSIGEYVAACLAGVFELDQALELVAARGRLIQQLPSGSMLAVPLPEADVLALLPPGVDLAAVNAPALCTASGTHEGVAQLEARLAERGVSGRRLHTSHPFHSAMMDPVLGVFAERVAAVPRRAPSRPFLSNVTGTWIRPEEATDPGYWARHLRQAVRFADGLATLREAGAGLLLEVGPGTTLTTLAQMQLPREAGVRVAASLPHPEAGRDDRAAQLEALGVAWAAGVAIDWQAVQAPERRRRVVLPTYPFERQRYWIDPPAVDARALAPAAGRRPVSEWFYTTEWRRTAEVALPVAAQRERRLILLDPAGLGEALATRLRERGDDVVTLEPGDVSSAEDWQRRIEELAQAGGLPRSVVHMGALGEIGQAELELQGFAPEQERGFYSLIFLAQALGRQAGESVDLTVVANGLHDVSGTEPLAPARATLLGPARVIPQEYPRLRCRVVDVALPAKTERLVEQLLREIVAPGPEADVALRGRHRLVPTPQALAAPGAATPVRHGGVYLITGGLGNLGLLLAEWLVREYQARVVLLGRSALPADPADPRAARLRELEAQGGTVVTVAADVADGRALRAVVEQTVARFGALNGVFHGAGLLYGDAFCPLPEITRASCERQFQAKVAGTQALRAALAGTPLDFVVLQSSLSALLGGLGFSAYAAGNLYMDALAQALSRETPGGPVWHSVSWDGWHFGPAPADRTDDQVGIRPEEAGEAFRSSLALSQVAPLLVSTVALEPRIAQWRTPAHERDDKQAQAAPSHGRPSGSREFVAPANDIESKLAGIWEELLGLAPIGRDDQFLELGGHSLLATQFVSRVREAYHVELPLRMIYERATVADFAGAVVRARAEQADEAELARLVAELEGLSEAETSGLLAQRGDVGAPGE